MDFTDFAASKSAMRFEDAQKITRLDRNMLMNVAYE